MTRAGRDTRHSSRQERAALVVFCAYIACALPLVLFTFGRARWFFGDEWSFLAERDAGDLGDLFRSHAEHWSTIPVIVYRMLFNLFGLRSYLPYQAVVVVAHLATAVLLRVVMRRAGVRPWTATVVASVFVLFGPGEENIVWAFQIGFVGAVMFGIVQLILSDHDGPIDRRDWFALLAGAASLMCSGVSLVMVGVAGLAVLLRRGWRPAAFQTVPLACLYGAWHVITDPGGIDNPYGRGASPRELARFSWSGVRGAVESIAGAHWLAFVLAGIVVGAIIVIAPRYDAAERRRLAAPLALVVGAGVFLVGTGYTRWYVTPTADSQSRYIYTLAAFMLPAIAVCADAIIQRWKMATPFVFGIFIVGIVINVGKFGDRPPFDDDFQRAQRELITAMAFSDEADSVPDYVRPNVWFTVGWLRSVADAGDMTRPGTTSTAVDRRVHELLSVAQLRDVETSDADCREIRSPTTIRPRRGDRYSVAFANEPGDGASYFVQDAIVVTPVENGRPAAPLSFKSEFGDTLEVEFDDLTLRVRPADPEQTLVLCRAARSEVNGTG